MPSHSPTSTYPFAVNFLTCLIQIWLMTTGDMFTFNSRIIVGFGGVAIILAVFPWLATLPDGWNYWICFVVLIFYGGFSGCAQGTVFTMAANLPFEYMGIVMFGNGVSGLSANVLRAITEIIFPLTGTEEENKQNSFKAALVFLSIGSVLLVISVIVQVFVLNNNKFYVYYLDWIAAEKAKKNLLSTDLENIEYGLVSPTLQNNKSDSSVSPTLSKNQSSNMSSPRTFRSGSDCTVVSIAKPPKKESLKEYLSSAKISIQVTKGLLTALFYVFCLTFICYPALSLDSSLKILYSLANSNGWYTILINTLFSLFDTIGRKMGGLKSLDLNIRTINIASGLRTVFIGTFFLICFEVGPSWLFNSDWFKILNMCLFAWSNGYVSTLCAVKAPDTVDDEKRGQVGGFIGAVISCGILAGSLITFAMTPIINLTPGPDA